MRKRCIRKMYVTANSPMEIAKFLASKLTDEEKNIEMVPIQTALDRIIAGDWDKHECWQPIFMCMNQIESLLKLNRIREDEWISDSQAVFESALDRELKTGATALTYSEIAKLREIVAVFYDLLQECTHRQLRDAKRHTDANVMRIIKNKKIKRVNSCVIEREAA